MNYLDALENVGQRGVSSWCCKGVLRTNLIMLY